MTMRNPIAALSLAIAACLTGTPAGAESLRAPDGSYAVGVSRVEFVDAARTQDPLDAASGPRRLPAVVWYPAQGSAPVSEGKGAYLPKASAETTLPAIARLFGYPAEELQPIGTVQVAARADAAPAKARRGFPVVVYSHGLFLYPEQNTALATQLASHGYIVVSIAHPGDAADLRLQDGRVVATRPLGQGDDPRFTEAWNVLAAGADLSVRRQALASYADAQAGTRIGRAATQWRDDMVFVANAIGDQREPQALRAVLATADRQRQAFAGMSMGGAAAAASCRQVNVCRAAVNLDGQNIDADLYDKPVQRPLLLMLSDWPRYGLLPPQPKDPEFSPNDLAYESWATAGQDSDVLRLRLRGIRHLGFTDLGLLLDGSERVARFGDIAPDQAASTVEEVVLAFLEVQLRGGDRSAVDAAIGRHPALVRHVPVRVRQWADQEREAN
jgi:predicted dienelactone hydrolase